MKNLKILLLSTLLMMGSLNHAFSSDFCNDPDPLLNDCSVGDATHYVNDSEDDHGIFIPLPYDHSDSVTFLRLLGVVGIMMVFDEQIMDVVQDNTNDFTARIANVGDLMGGRNGLAPFLLGSYAVGLVFRNNNLRRTALSSIANAALSGAIVEVLKAITHRNRPRDNNGAYQFDGPAWSSDNTSFPSAHSAGAWAVATVFATNYSETRWVPVLAYGMATLVSWSRTHDFAHWASDVTLGAGIAYFTGKLFRRRTDQERRYSGGLMISPAVGFGTTGVNVYWTPRRCIGEDDSECRLEDEFLFNE